MANILWYYCVSAIGLALIVFTLAKHKAILHLFAFLLAAASVAYLLEVVVLFVLRGYDYMPGIYSDPIAESIFGHLVCNGFFWGGFTLIAAVFSLRPYWFLIFSGFFMLVEVFFQALHLYVHHWWKLYYTGIGVVIFLIFCKKWLYQLRWKQTQLLRTVTFFFIAWILLAGPSIVLLIAGSQHFESGLSPNYYLSDIYLDVPYHLGLSLVIVQLVNVFGKPYHKAAAFFFVLICDGALSYSNILTFHNGWDLFYWAALRFLTFALYLLLEKTALKADAVATARAPAF